MRRFAVSVLITLLLTQPALATDVGITPDSPLYPLKRILEDLDILFTFDEVAKAEKLLKYAKLRIAEAEEMAEKGKTKYVSDLLRDYRKELGEAVDLMKSAKPKDVPKIAELIVNETLSDLEMLEKLSNRDGLTMSSEIYTVKMGEEAIAVLRNYDPTKAYLLSLNMTRGLLKIADEKASRGEDAGFLLRESEKLMRQPAGNMNGAFNIVEEIKSIIDEATNVSLIRNPKNRNVSVDIIERGLKIYRRLGMNLTVQ